MRVLQKLNLKDVLFLDIETSTVVPELKLDTPLFEAYKYTNRGLETDQDVVDTFPKNAALIPEFGRIVCISIGMLTKEGSLKTKTFNNLDEKILISDFYTLLSELKRGTLLCGHNVKVFDIPYITRRGIVNGLSPHSLVDFSGLKPWEIDWVIDTKELSQMGGYNKPSLVTLCSAFGIPSPKDDISGADVPELFWKDPKGNIDRISIYCEKDVDRTYQVLKVLKDPSSISEIDKPIEETTLIISLFNGGSYGQEEEDLLKGKLLSLSDSEREKAFVILKAMCSSAKGKTTAIKSKDLTRIKKELSK